MSQIALDATRQRLLISASDVFARKGFRDATVREICQLAQANVAAVNYHFGDKHRLYIETVKYAQIGRAEDVPMPAWSEETAPEQKLRDFVAVMVERMLGDPREGSFFQLMVHEMAQPTEACTELVRDYIRPHFEILLGIIGQLVPASCTLQQRQLIAFSVVGQCLHHRVAQPVIRLLTTEEQYARLTAAVIADHIACFTLAAIKGISANSSAASADAQASLPARRAKLAANGPGGAP